MRKIKKTTQNLSKKINWDTYTCILIGGGGIWILLTNLLVTLHKYNPTYDDLGLTIITIFLGILSFGISYKVFK